MRDFWILTKLQVSSLFGINKILHMKSEEEKKIGKRSLRALIAMAVALSYVSIQYSIMLSTAFETLGMLPTLLGLMALASSILILMFSIFETKGVLFGFGDYDIVMSWPVSIRAVTASRVFSMYVYNFIYGFLLLAPSGVIYALKTSPALWFYPLLLILILLIPALPTIIGALLGTALTLATARMKKSNFFHIIAQMGLVIGIMFISFQMNMGVAEDGGITGNFAGIQNAIQKAYPPALWFQNALSTGSLPEILGLALLTIISIGILLLWLGKNFVSINSRILSKPRGETFVMRRQTRSGKIPALFRRELSRYFSSSLYVVNTAFGYIMLLAAGVALFIKAEAVLNFLGTQDVSAAMIPSVIPFFFGWIVSMGTTTASSISMEGKSLWIVKSLPVSAREWLTAKLMLSLMLAVPSILIASTLVAIGLKLSLIEAIWLYLIPLIFATAFGIFGLWVNIRMPRLDWKNEAEVVKQGGATMVTVFVGMFAGFGAMIVAGLTNSLLVSPVVFVLAAVLSLIMWRSLMKNGEQRLLSLH